MSLDLYALVLHLHPTEAAMLPAMAGAQAHAAFLATVRAVNPSLAAWLHEDHGPDQPFGVSLLAPWRALRERRWHVQPGDTLKLRVTLAGQPLYETFMQHFLEGGHQLRLGTVPCETGRVITSGIGEALAGHATMARLFEEATPAEEQRLRFVMPTTWRTGQHRRHFALFPEPYPLFQKLSRNWEHWAAPSLRYEYEPLLAALREEQVLVTSYQLQTVHWQGEKPPTQGFIGWIHYRVDAPREIRRIVDLLCRFSFFSGVGNASGRGLGVVVPEGGYPGYGS
jgi:CRISPR-associated endoribonuclease Cas6